MPHDLNIVLVEPEIPMNTGTIGRLCLATETTLHLIEPMGFEINDSKLKRAGLDYWKHVKTSEFPSWDDFIAEHVPKDSQIYLFSSGASRPYFDIKFKENQHHFNKLITNIFIFCQRRLNSK